MSKKTPTETTDQLRAAKAHQDLQRSSRRQQQKLLEELDQANKRLDFLAGLDKARQKMKPIKAAGKGRVLSGDRRHACAVALASDWHVEERVDRARVSGLNEYNPEIAEVRARRFFAGVEWLVREQQSMFDIKDLVLWLGGDLITGYLHEELLEGNFMSPTEAVVFAMRLISEGLQFLIKNTQLNIRIPCSIGNHGRTTARTRIGTAASNSYEWLMYHMLRTQFASEPRIQFQIAEGHHLITQIYDMRVHFHHGDSVRSQGGIGGITVPLNRACLQWHQKYDAHLTCVGHFHQYGNQEKLVTNGSLIGVSGYSDWLPGAGAEPARQAFFLIDSKRGKTQCAPLWVQE